MILVSACLVGRPCRYDGRGALSPELVSDLAGRPWLAVCPEQLGGLATPRTPARLKGGDGEEVLSGRARVVDTAGQDVTGAFIHGAEAVLDLAVRLKVEICYLKDRSPSCGLTVSSGESGPVKGPGVLAALLIRSGFKVVEVKARGTDW
ncbi:MAG: DUF523 domain-containing protein [Thermodesulfobacteriota bacterium]